MKLSFELVIHPETPAFVPHVGQELGRMLRDLAERLEPFSTPLELHNALRNTWMLADAYGKHVGGVTVWDDGECDNNLA